MSSNLIARSMKWILRGLVIGLAVAVVLLTLRVRDLEGRLTPRYDPGPAAEPMKVQPRGDLSAFEKATIELFDRASQSVVHITTLAIRADPFRMNVMQQPRGTGSGFVWDDQGHVVTNFHVVKGAQGARVTFADQSIWAAELVGVSARHDLAVLRVAGMGKRAAPLQVGTSHDLVVGQQVIAIGSPFGLDYTLSTGVISGLGREIDGVGGLPIRGAIQTDAAINPGNSGGPLIGSGGRLIGVNTSILSPSGASAGIGFAVPVDVVARVVPQLIRHGKEVRPLIGVELAPDHVARRVGVQGALVVRVQKGSPAAAAGIRGTREDTSTGEILLGDVITKIGEDQILNSRDIHLALDVYLPGQTLKIELLRGRKTATFELKLAASLDP